jgi:hypothetical protein
VTLRFPIEVSSARPVVRPVLSNILVPAWLDDEVRRQGASWKDIFAHAATLPAIDAGYLAVKRVWEIFDEHSARAAYERRTRGAR